jgi:hypothetical protein
MANELASATIPSSAPANAELARPPAPAEAPALPSPLDAVQAGQIPGITLSAFNDKDPLHEFVVSNLDALSKFGLDYVELTGKDHLSVVFNPAKITAESLQEAHKAGDLDKIVPLAPSVPVKQAAASDSGEPGAPTDGAGSSQLAGATLPAPRVPAGVQEARGRNLASISIRPGVPSGGPAAAFSKRAF